MSEISQNPLIRTVFTVATIWVLSDLGFYFLLPALGVKTNYNTGSVAIALYYIFWIGITVITFWELFSRHIHFNNRLASYLVWSVAFGGCTLFAAYVLPLLPATRWTQPWVPPDVVVATELYFLPKSVDILFQQLLIVALVLSLAAQRLSLRKISLYSALLFGGFHILLVFSGVPWGYIIRFMLFATLFGFIFPFLILRVPNGLDYSYMLHWFYYAVTVLMPRFFSTPIT